MLATPYRLQKERDFQRVYGFGRSFFTNDLNLKFTRNNSQKSRFGFVINHKITNKATKRNKLKRQFREIVRKKISQIKNGFDIVFIAKKIILNKTFQEKEEILKTLLERAKLIKHD